MRLKALLGAAVASLLIVSPAVAANAAKPTVQPFRITDQVDPSASQAFTVACGVPIEVSDSGTVVFVDSGVRQMTLQSLTETFTNTDTDASITLTMAVQVTTTLRTLDANGSFTFTAAFRGLNFRYRDASGQIVSAGRGELTLTVVLDEKGNEVSVEFTDVATPKLAHSTSLICPLLGGTAP